MPETTEAKKEITTPISHPWRLFGFEVFLFAVSMLLGVLAGFRLNSVLETQNIQLRLVSFWEVLLPFIIGTAVLVLVVYFLKLKKVKGVFFKVLFALAIGFGNLYFLGLWLPPLLVFLWVGFLIIFLLKKSSLLLHNAGLVFAVAGVAAGVGLQLKPETVVLLLLVLSLYDFIAVYQTKHMVRFAKEMVAQRAILGIVIPQKITDLTAPLKEVKPGGRFLILGAGDIAFPLILAVSLIPQGLLSVLIVAFCSLLGLLFGFLIFVSKKVRSPMPALPPIALLSILGYFLTLFL